MKTLLTVIALTTAVACGKKVEAVPTVTEPAKVEAVKEEVKTVSGVQSPVVVETVTAPDAGVTETPVTPVVPAPPASPVK
jgi:hypothetical protein